jgi:hypothetical protein
LRRAPIASLVCLRRDRLAGSPSELSPSSSPGGPVFRAVTRRLPRTRVPPDRFDRARVRARTDTLDLQGRTIRLCRDQG